MEQYGDLFSMELEKKKKSNAFQNKKIKKCLMEQ